MNDNNPLETFGWIAVIFGRKTAQTLFGWYVAGNTILAIAFFLFIYNWLFVAHH